VRIVSLVPSATETLFALGLGGELIAVTHECDHPAAARELPHVTRDLLPAGLSSREIDAAVRERTRAGEAIYALDADLLLDLRPELIVTQELCEVCAVSADDVRSIAGEIDPAPEVLTLDPSTLGEVLADIGRLAASADAEDGGAALVAELAGRVDAVREATAGVTRRPRVAALEWLDPVFAAGHWTPQLIEYAGGEDVLGLPGERSEERTWEEVSAASPDVIVAMPCGYDLARSAEEAEAHRQRLAAAGAGEVLAVDAAAWFSRPGPRLVDGLEVLAHALHPDVVSPGPGEAMSVAI